MFYGCIYRIIIILCPYLHTDPFDTENIFIQERTYDFYCVFSIPRTGSRDLIILRILVRSLSMLTNYLLLFIVFMNANSCINIKHWSQFVIFISIVRCYVMVKPYMILTLNNMLPTKIDGARSLRTNGV